VSFIGELKRRNVIRVAIAYLAGAWLLIQILETLFPIFGLEETSIRVVVIILAIGFLPAVIAAWVFEITPEGLVRDGGTPAHGDAASHARFDRIIIATLVLAVAVFGVHTFVLDPQRDAAERDAAREEGRTDALVESFGDKSIAVLAFANMSSDPEQAYFADGIAEELLNLLARVQDLRVISRTSAFKFKGSNVSIPEIAKQLNVRYVLEGSVRRAGEMIRITAQLIDARADTHVWSETYDRKFEDIFAVQDDVAARVVEELKIEMSVGMPTAPRHDTAAYSLYLRARQLLNTSSDDYELLKDLLVRALEIDPDFADAKVELANVYGMWGQDAFHSGNTELAEERWLRENSILDEVAAVAPDNVALNISIAFWKMSDPGAAARYLEKALAVDSTNDRALNIAVILLTRLWREAQAIPIAEYVARRDPLYTHVRWNLARAQLNSGAYEAAEKTYRLIAEIQGDGVRTHWSIGIALLMQGHADSALAHFQNFVPDELLRLHGSVLALHRLDRHDEAQAALESLVAKLESSTARGSAFLAATASAWVGNLDDAFEYLEIQRQSDPGWLRVVANSPLYENFKDDPRWLPFLELAGLASQQLGAVEFNPRLPPELLTRPEMKPK
jgi:TolB-like protein